MCVCRKSGSLFPLPAFVREFQGFTSGCIWFRQKLLKIIQWKFNSPENGHTSIRWSTDFESTLRLMYRCFRNWEPFCVWKTMLSGINLKMRFFWGLSTSFQQPLIPNGENLAFCQDMRTQLLMQAGRFVADISLKGRIFPKMSNSLTKTLKFWYSF